MTGLAGTLSPRFDENLEHACDGLPGLVQSALVMLPEGLLLGGTGGASALDHEPLVRAAEGCFASFDADDSLAERMFEYVFVSIDRIVVIQRGRNDTRIALAVVCTRAANLALVMSASRQALLTLEASLVGWHD